jgi:hypothetical protein
VSHIGIRAIALVLCLLLSSCGSGSTSSGGNGPGTDPNGFAKLLGPTFTHPRCQNCHGFETENQFKIRHRELGRLDQDCGDCHFTPGWEAPFQSFSFSDISTAQICTAIKNKTGNDAQALRESILNSTLARWAIEDGGTLSGTLPVAPPNNMTELARIIDQWIAAGALCD